MLRGLAVKFLKRSIRLSNFQGEACLPNLGNQMSQLASRRRRRECLASPYTDQRLNLSDMVFFYCVWRFPTSQGISGCAPQTSGHSRQCPAPLGHLSNVWRSPPTQTSFLASHIMPHIIAPTEPGPFGLLSAQSFFCVSSIRSKRAVVFRYRQREMECPSTDGVRKTGSTTLELIFWDVNEAMASRIKT